VTAKLPKNYRLQYMLSVAYRAEHRWEEALKAARAAQKADPKKIVAYQAIMEVSLDNTRPKEALKALDLAAKQKVDEYRYWLQLGELYIILREREPSLEIPPEQITAQYEKAMALNPEEPEVLVRLADHFLYTKNLKRAIELYLKILERQPDAIDIYQKLALSYVQDGDKKQAISTLEEIVKKEPLKYQIHNLIGELNESLKDWAAARTAYKSSLIVNPDQLENYLKVCLLELRLQNPDGAFEVLKKAKEKFPDMPQVPYFHGLAYSELKDYPKSVMAFEEAYLMSQSNPNIRLESDFYFYYGAACERNGEFERSVNLFKKAIELNPDYADAYNYLGYMYADKGINLDESLKLIEKAISYEPNNGAFIDSLGWIYYKLGKYDKALVELQKAVDLIKDDAVVFEHLGDVYQKLGKRDDAAVQWQKAFQHDPKNEAILKKLKDAGVDPTSIPALEPGTKGGDVHPSSKVPEKKI
jgi:tetratricopeptide (TPR) repeat protein